MKLLLDTQVLLWFLADSRRLARPAKKQIVDADEVWVSAASIWEISIKAAIGKLKVNPADVAAEIAPNGFAELPVLARHAIEVAHLPWHHRDPFDRLLIAQAAAEPLLLMTSDRILSKYPAPVTVV
ncbi:MAG: type II toxin-antitoxin system VapC family toxin [Candidatus Xenobia bacterium]